MPATIAALLSTAAGLVVLATTIHLSWQAENHHALSLGLALARSGKVFGRLAVLCPLAILATILSLPALGIAAIWTAGLTWPSIPIVVIEDLPIGRALRESHRRTKDRRGAAGAAVWLGLVGIGLVALAIPLTIIATNLAVTGELDPPFRAHPRLVSIVIESLRWSLMVPLAFALSRTYGRYAREGGVDKRKPTSGRNYDTVRN